MDPTYCYNFFKFKVPIKGQKKVSSDREALEGFTESHICSNCKESDNSMVSVLAKTAAKKNALP
jgi:hypothetical protein